jgi:transcriptional regulator with XRE-family HTH domain
MITSLYLVPPTTDFAPIHYNPEPAFIRPAQFANQPVPLLTVGTGGLASELFLRQGIGYLPYQVIEHIQTAQDAPYAKLMEQVKTGFGRTMSRLPVVFGVSRQTLYNWLNGETPKPVYQERIKQLADAAQVFADMGFKPTTSMLDRTVSQGKTFLQLMASGAPGQETAKKLIRIVERGNDSRNKLDKLLAGRKASLTAPDFGAPAANERV